MRIVFMGTPAAAVPTLRRCVEDGHEVVAVWTQPDRPSGRGNKVSFSPVKEFALAKGLTIYQPTRLRSEETKSLFSSHESDVAVVVAYGRILPAEFLKAPRNGCLNVHFSLLPRYRGASPVNWAIVNGETETGVTTMFIEPTLDTGPILLQTKTMIGQHETAPELMARLAETGADLLGETLARLNTLTPLVQDHAAATFAPILKKEDGLIDWTMNAKSIEQRVRGFQSWPNAYTSLNSKGFTIWRAEVITSEQTGLPGEVIESRGDSLVVACGDASALRLVEVQPEAKRRMVTRDFLNGTHLKVGDRFGQ
ncbi:MAG TPA: methionyl-tRNA formyltransferase [Pyrinomonadaceae bacterium]|jgi:methionyl-tRNA formyltransferase|nr:methionyl-tRNA formyltransferase [Pyrinomonadaceae bacterium]